MSPDLLKAFLAVAETGNFTLAGHRVFRTQGAVSQMIKRLEAELDCTLLDRRKSPVKLTEDGKRLLPHAQAILAAEAAALAAFDRSEISGPVSLGMPEVYADVLIPRILPSFQERFPKVRINLDLRDTVELVALQQSGALDLTFATEGEVPELTGRIVHRAPIIWMAPLGRALEHADPLPLVVWKKGTSYEKTVVSALEESGRRTSIVVNTQTLSGMTASVRANLGVAAAAESPLTEGVRILKKGLLPTIPARVVRLEKSNGKGRPVVDALASHIEEVLHPEETP